VFLFVFLPGLLSRVDTLAIADQSVNVELLVSVVAFSLTALSHMEWALRVVEGDKRQGGSQKPEIRVMGEPSASLALMLATELKKSKSPTASVVLQRLSSSDPFVANFPMFASG
jgi:mediator of RNA polymerase II transcription subunit 5